MFKRVKTSDGESLHASYVSSGDSHFCAISKDDKKVYVWGLGKFCGVVSENDGLLPNIITEPLVVPCFEKLRIENSRQARPDPCAKKASLQQN